MRFSIFKSLILLLFIGPFGCYSHAEDEIRQQSNRALTGCRMALEGVPEGVSKVTNPIVVFGSVIGHPPERASILSENESHFGEFADFNTVFESTMLKVLAENFEGHTFADLNLAQQELAIRVFVEEILRENETSATGESFFRIYLMKWRLGFSQDFDMGAYMDYVRKAVLDPDLVTAHFVDFFLLYFRFGSENINLSTAVLEELWAQRDYFEDDVREVESLTGEDLLSLNPVREGNDNGGFFRARMSSGLENFMSSSGAIVFDQQQLRLNLLNIEQSVRLLEHEPDQMKRSQQLSELWNDLSDVLVDIEFFYRRKITVLEEINEAYQDKVDRANRTIIPRMFRSDKGPTDEAIAVAEKYKAVLAHLYDYEVASQLVFGSDISDLIAELDKAAEVHFLEADGLYGKQTVLTRIDQIALQKEIILANIVKFTEVDQTK